MLLFFIGIAGGVLSYLGSVAVFYLSTLAPLILQALLEGSLTVFGARGAKSWRIATPQGQPGEQGTRWCWRRPKAEALVVSSVIGAIDGRRVQIEISFGEGFYHRRVAIAWVHKPRAAERLPVVTFVICSPDDTAGAYLVQVPDEQLGDFEEITGHPLAYRLTSVLHLEAVYE